MVELAGFFVPAQFRRKKIFENFFAPSESPLKVLMEKWKSFRTGCFSGEVTAFKFESLAIYDAKKKIFQLKSEQYDIPVFAKSPEKRKV